MAVEKAAAVTVEDIKTTAATAVIMVATMEDITAATMVAAMADMMAEAEAIAAAGIAAEAEDTDVEAVVVAEEEVTSPPRPHPRSRSRAARAATAVMVPATPEDVPSTHRKCRAPSAKSGTAKRATPLSKALHATSSLRFPRLADCPRR